MWFKFWGEYREDRKNVQSLYCKWGCCFNQWKLFRIVEVISGPKYPIYPAEEVCFEDADNV